MSRIMVVWLRPGSPSGLWTGWGPCRCWDYWWSSAQGADVGTRTGVHCWRPPWTHCWCTRSWAATTEPQTITTNLFCNVGHSWIWQDEIFDLEWLSLNKGELGQLSLLTSPNIADAAVPDNHLLAVLIEARVEVEGQVTWCSQIDGDPIRQQKKHGSNSDTTGSSTTTWRSIACSFSTVCLVIELLTWRGGAYKLYCRQPPGEVSHKPCLLWSKYWYVYQYILTCLHGVWRFHQWWWAICRKLHLEASGYMELPVAKETAIKSNHPPTIHPCIHLSIHPSIHPAHWFLLKEGNCSWSRSNCRATLHGPGGLRVQSSTYRWTSGPDRVSRILICSHKHTCWIWLTVSGWNQTHNDDVDQCTWPEGIVGLSSPKGATSWLFVARVRQIIERFAQLQRRRKWVQIFWSPPVAHTVLAARQIGRCVKQKLWLFICVSWPQIPNVNI